MINFTPGNGQFEDFEPGDVLNLRPQNSSSKVDQFFSIFSNLNLNPDDLITLSQMDPGE